MLIFVASTSWFTGEHTGTIVIPILAWLFPNADRPTLLAAHAVIRKLGHFTEYLVFGVLIVRALRDADEWRWRHAVMAIALATLYAVTDEVHQYFVPGRTAAVGDVVIDGFGAFAGQVVFALRQVVGR